MLKAWIPNSLSLGNLLFGFAAIIIASQNIEESSVIRVCCILIIIAALLDGFDGFLARLLKVESSLGEYLDTLADMTTFGIAPGVIAYQLFLKEITYPIFGFTFPLGILLAGIYPMCAAYRLARFSVAHNPSFFIGLPSPTGASLLIFFIFLFPFKIPHWLICVQYFFISFLLVSNIKYTKPQVAVQEHINMFRLIMLFLFLAVIIFLYGWYWMFFGVLFLYTFSGFISILFGLIQKFRVG